MIPSASIGDLLAEAGRERRTLEAFAGPVELVRRGLALPQAPGVYVVAAGGCVAHIGTSGNLRARIRTLASLGTHRGSAEVLCAAYCTRKPPLVWWHETDKQSATALERMLKSRYGEPPLPRADHSACVNGTQLLADITRAVGPDSWEAGYAEAVFAIGEKLSLLFAPRFRPIWETIGVPPGPWELR